MRALATAVVLAALAGPAAAQAAGPKYKFVSRTTLTTVTRSDCAPGEGGVRTIETLTWELKSKQTGTSEIARTSSGQPKGSTKTTGTIRRETKREYEGTDPAPPQGGTEPMQEDLRTYGALHRASGGRLELYLDHAGMLDPLFSPLKPGRSITLTQHPADLVDTRDDGHCVDEERTTASRTIKITRIR
jgi:hypothetical protein